MNFIIYSAEIGDFIKFPIWFIFAVAIINLLIDIITKSERISPFIKKHKIFIKRIINHSYIKKDSKFSKAVSTKEYLDWERNILKILYDKDINSFNDTYSNNNKGNLKFAYQFAKPSFLKNSVQYNDYFYDSLVLNLPKKYKDNCIYPFYDVFNKDDVKFNNLDKIEKNSEFKKRYKNDPEIIKFFKMKSTKISYPNNVDYDLDEILLNNGNFPYKIKAQTGLYKYNVCDSHYLTYELYKFYLIESKKVKVKEKLKKYQSLCSKKKNKQSTRLLNKIDSIKTLSSFDNDDEKRNYILQNLPKRSELHQKVLENNSNILLSGYGRSSLLSVQMMVAVKNKITKQYDVLRMKRSKFVDSKAGFLQFIPAGGFSSLVANSDFDVQFSNASISKAILRELLEECFGKEDFSGKKMISSEQIYSDENIKKITNLIIDKNNDTNIYFLGSALNLNDLRHELNFLLVLDDPDIVSNMCPNEETENVINFISYNRLKDINFWLNYPKDKDSNDKKITDIDLLVSSSAALLQAVEDSNILDCLNEKALISNTLLELDEKSLNYICIMLSNKKNCTDLLNLDNQLLISDNEYKKSQENFKKYFSSTIFLNNDNYHIYKNIQNLKEFNKKIHDYLSNLKNQN